MKNEILKKLNDLHYLVIDTIEKWESDKDINDNLRMIALKQMEICDDHFEYVLDKSSKKIEEILENEKQENI